MNNSLLSLRREDIPC